MGCHSNGASRPLSSGGLNAFALVVYIPDPLGRFLDDLRKELVPGCKPHAHVSVLPPRPLATDTEPARAEARALASEFPPFPVEAGELRIFGRTNVVYIEIARGAPELTQMHQAFMSGLLRYDEPFPYHPHITLVQDVPPEQVPELFEIARWRWKEYDGNRRFTAERMFFVQNTLADGWIDLEEIELGTVPVR